MPNTPGQGLPNEQHYTVTSVAGGDVVSDDATGLLWQRDTATGTYAWDQAVAYCEALDLGGQTDWRLPAMIELVSIIDFGNVGPAIDEVAFPNALPPQPGVHVFWSATPSSSFTSGRPWDVDFGFGETFNFDPVNTPYLVRCVRGPVSVGTSGCRFTISGGTAQDPGTGLTWQRIAPTATFTWAAAMAYCPTVTDDGGGWRLPSIKELLTLVDNTRYNPAIDVATFSNTSDAFWSATPQPGSSASAWNVRFYLGESDISLPVTSGAQVRCVR